MVTSGIKLLVFETKKEGLDMPPNSIIQSSFITLLIGPPGSGKTTMIKQLLYNKDIFYQKFDKVFFVTPSVIDGINMDASNWSKSLSTEWMEKKVSECMDMKNICFILDDVASSLKSYDNNPPFLDLFLNRRHKLKDGTIH